MPAYSTSQAAKATPCPAQPRVRPPKSEVFDREVVALVEQCRNCSGGEEREGGESPEYIEEEAPAEMGVRSDSEYDDDEAVYTGVLEFSDKFWFLRTHNFELTSGGDVFVHTSFVNRFRLREGDFITCKAKRRRENECPGATYIVSVNGVRPDMLNPRAVFEQLIPCYPVERYTLERRGGTLTDRVIDLFSPIGKGQRALIVSPPKAGKTTMLKDIACSITENYPQSEVIVLLIDERPEEVTDIRRTVAGAKVVYSTFDKGEHHHIHAAQLTLEHAKRLVEAGKDVVILLDSITRLTRAYNSVTNSGRMLSGGLDPQALTEPRKFFGAARNTEDGGLAHNYCHRARRYGQQARRHYLRRVQVGGQYGARLIARTCRAQGIPRNRYPRLGREEGRPSALAQRTRYRLQTAQAYARQAERGKSVFHDSKDAEQCRALRARRRMAENL